MAQAPPPHSSKPHVSLAHAKREGAGPETRPWNRHAQGRLGAGSTSVTGWVAKGWWSLWDGALQEGLNLSSEQQAGCTVAIITNTVITM